MAPALGTCYRITPLGQGYALPNHYCVRFSSEVTAIYLFCLEVARVVGLLIF